jgi:hypothetical protein
MMSDHRFTVAGFEPAVIDYSKTSPAAVIVAASAAAVAWREVGTGRYPEQLRSVTDQDRSLGAPIYRTTITLLDAVVRAALGGSWTFTEVAQSDNYDMMDILDIVNRAVLSAALAISRMPQRGSAPH